VAGQLLIEVLVLALAGAAAGLLLAGAAAGVFRALARDLPRVEEIALDWRVVAYSLACALAATVICGVLPAIRATGGSLAGALGQTSRTQVSGRKQLHLALVGIQLALAVPLLAGAGLLLRSFHELGRVSPGFDPDNVLTFHISTSWGETGDPKASAQLVDRILNGLRSIPGVETAATTYWLPGVPAEYEVELKTSEGRAETEPNLRAESRFVGPEYFHALRIPLVAGELCRTDANTSAVMVNRSFADTYFGGTAALGRHLSQPGNAYIPPSEIRGIVGDAREIGLDRPTVPTVYWCNGGSQPGTYFVVRSHNSLPSLPRMVRRKLSELEPARSVYDFALLQDRISDAFAENRLRTILLSFFAATAIALANVGLYGTLSYLVNLRRREVALRLALGAVRGQVIRQFLWQAVRVSAFGCATGLGLALVFGRLLARMLFGVAATDSATLAAVVAIVLAVSIPASLVPAVRAARLEPSQMLREA